MQKLTQEKNTTETLDPLSFIQGLLTPEELIVLNEKIDMLVEHVENTQIDSTVFLGTFVDENGSVNTVFRDFNSLIGVSVSRFMDHASKLKTKDKLKKYDQVITELVHLLEVTSEKKVDKDLKNYFYFYFLKYFFSKISMGFIKQNVIITPKGPQGGPLVGKVVNKIKIFLNPEGKTLIVQNIDKIAVLAIQRLLFAIPDVDVDMNWQEVFDFLGIFKTLKPVTLQINEISKVIISPFKSEESTNKNLSDLCMIEYFFGGTKVVFVFDYMTMNIKIGEGTSLDVGASRLGFNFGVKLSRFILWNILKQTDPEKENFQDEEVEVEHESSSTEPVDTVAESKTIENEQADDNTSQIKPKKIKIKLGMLSGRELLSKIERLAKVLKHDIKGDHHNFKVLVDGKEKDFTIPTNGSGDILRVYVVKVIKALGVTREEFKKA
jgi:flagellin-specific chaperone FliS